MGFELECALGDRQEFCVEVVSNGMRELMDFKTGSVKDVLVKFEKLELLESFENCRGLEEVTMELLGKRVENLHNLMKKK